MQSVSIRDSSRPGDHRRSRWLLWRTRRLRDRRPETCLRERGSRLAARAAWSSNACACAAERDSRHRRSATEWEDRFGSPIESARGTLTLVGDFGDERRVETRVVAVGRQPSALQRALSASDCRSRRFPRRAASARHRHRRCRDRRPRRSRPTTIASAAREPLDGGENRGRRERRSGARVRCRMSRDARASGAASTSIHAPASSARSAISR